MNNILKVTARDRKDPSSWYNQLPPDMRAQIQAESEPITPVAPVAPPVRAKTPDAWYKQDALRVAPELVHPESRKSHRTAAKPELYRPLRTQAHHNTRNIMLAVAIAFSFALQLATLVTLWYVWVK